MSSIREEIIRIGRKMVNAGLVVESLGNISCRSSKGILITPTKLDYYEMEPEDIVEIDLKGNRISSKNKIESPPLSFCCTLRSISTGVTWGP